MRMSESATRGSSSSTSSLCMHCPGVLLQHEKHPWHGFTLSLYAYFFVILGFVLLSPFSSVLIMVPVVPLSRFGLPFRIRMFMTTLRVL